jgi:ADP-ribose pyrophosphatase YjhB (NUDIX family)
MFYAGAFLYNPKTDEVLLHHRDDKTIYNPNKWTCFGGTSEEGETPIQTVIREVKEELDLDLALGDLKSLCDYFNDQRGNHRYVYYVISEVSKSDMKLGEGQGFDWIPMDNVFSYDLTEKTKNELEMFAKLRVQDTF